ncbi:hypothetical protein PVL30_004468 [Lodderomyces elongisporus]|uniref:uncharacterized protein n=1 Tax=Lodderomyces elongisporus TaxID=36914 RepID=UPI002923131E|nr:uncharacterized protein PVL30_004468 [Lodderomyces elongisporus]WLF80682.1 hypothetical protein PVL30_004468 [Lodderomyces elongisporus]
MGVPFPDINPYEVLGVQPDASPIIIKRTYKKLCLKHHPDKKHQQRKAHGAAAAKATATTTATTTATRTRGVNAEGQMNNDGNENYGEDNGEQDDDDDEEMFTKIQFAFSILNDPVKRNRYDTLGSLSEVDFGDGDGDGDEGFNWKEYFDSINQKITIEMIEEDKMKYQGSEEEKHDIIAEFIYYEGDFLKLFEVIPHLEFTEFEEQRVYKIIEGELQEMKDVDSSITKSWEKYTKSRKTKVKNMLSKLAKEAKEAKELEKKLLLKDKRGNKGSDLKSMIRSRQNNRMDSLIANLESKYADKKGRKRHSRDIDDDEFERIQQEMMKKKQTH